MIRLLVTCEHGGNRVPRGFEALFRGAGHVLRSHRGYDRGAIETAKFLARRLGAELRATSVTRLLVDTNRSEDHPSLFSEITGPLDAELREKLLDRFYRPHRNAVETSIKGWIDSGYTVVHVASHSFTPVLEGKVRHADVSWLYDPQRREEREFVHRWRAALRTLRPDLRLRRNYPYRGSADGLTTHLRRAVPESSYIGIELEVNQRLAAGTLRHVLAESLGDTLGTRAATRR
ncbi:MAG TPA: N-formylglutamate amidohydrolase [Vicinamibacteria bacterium]|nr:N-formylglutamate amidohydrolase [Vicinamibacteria bacterium]